MKFTSSQRRDSTISLMERRSRTCARLSFGLKLVCQESRPPDQYNLRSHVILLKASSCRVIQDLQRSLRLLRFWKRRHQRKTGLQLRFCLLRLRKRNLLRNIQLVKKFAPRDHHLQCLRG